MNVKYKNLTYVFHSTKTYVGLVQSYVKSKNFINCDVISDDKIKSHILKKSFFAVAKAGTISLEICNAKIPSIILYKMNAINFFIIKLLVKTKFANIINIAAKKEIIPELLQSNCNANNIFKNVSSFLDNPNKIKDQINKIQNILNELKTDKPSAHLAAKSLVNFLEK